MKRRIVVWATITRHGKPKRVKRHKTIRVAVPPHTVSLPAADVRHGKATSVSGWLGTSGGTALAGQTVSVLAAPDNGLGNFAQITTAVTNPSGGWTAAIPAGPSRLIEAQYAGASTLEPSVSSQVNEHVPAKVKLLSVTPRRVAWGGTVTITGQLVGGYLPPAGALVRLRLGQGQRYSTYGVQEHVTGNGRFVTTYTFGAGVPSVHQTFWFQIATLPVGDYPWTPAASGKRTVAVGGNPPPPCCL